MTEPELRKALQHARESLETIHVMLVDWGVEVSGSKSPIMDKILALGEVVSNGLIATADFADEEVMKKFRKEKR